MAKQRPSVQKQQRDHQKRQRAMRKAEKAAQKRERRLNRDEEESAATEPGLDQAVGEGESDAEPTS